jgi:hypothetical protein
MSVVARPRPTTPPLENGDVMSRKEFHRRYVRAKHIKKAELIEGRVVVASPVYFETHGEPDGLISLWLGYFSARTSGVRFGGNVSVKIDSRNEYQPDQVLFIDPSRGGQVRDAAKCLIGLPEFVAEVAASSTSVDSGLKKSVYLRAGVREFLLVRTLDQKVDWFVARDGRFDPLPVDANGVIRSATFPGLWLDASALLKGDAAVILATLDLGLATSEHARFVQDLAARKPVPAD